MLQLTLPGDNMKIPYPSGFKFTGEKGNIGGLISEALKYVFPLAGLILFGMLIFGGFELLTSSGNPEAIKKGQDKITSAVIGFVIIFVAYWLVQILQAILGLEKIFWKRLALIGYAARIGQRSRLK